MLEQLIYSPLANPALEIRLLTISPSADISAPIDGLLEVVSLDTCSLETRKPYKALSYAWGDPAVTAPIRLNGFQKQVTVNLAAALRREQFSLSLSLSLSWFSSHSHWRAHLLIHI